MSKRAVIVGCSYAGSRKALQGTDDDVTAISKMIQEVYEVPKTNITVFREGGKYSAPVTGANVRKQVADYCAASVAGDSLLFYFAGHGTRLPVAPRKPEWAMVMADLDIITRADLNDIFAACPQGVAFTVIADSSCSHSLLPYPVANGASGKTRYVKAGGRFLAAAAYIKAFNTKYPQAGMTKDTIAEKLAAQFPEGASKIATRPGQQAAQQGGGAAGQRRPRGWRRAAAGPIGEAREGEEEPEEEAEEEEGGRRERRERRERDDEEGDARRRNRRGRDEGEEEEPEKEEEEGDKPAPQKPGAGQQKPGAAPAQPAAAAAHAQPAAAQGQPAEGQGQPAGGGPAGGRRRAGWRSAGPIGEGREGDSDEEDREREAERERRREERDEEREARREERDKEREERDKEREAERQRRREEGERRRTEGRRRDSDDEGRRRDSEDEGEGRPHGGQHGGHQGHHHAPGEECEEGVDPALDGRPAPEPEEPPVPTGPPAAVKPPGGKPKPPADAEEEDADEEDVTEDEASYTEDRDWPEPSDADDEKIRPNQGVLFAAGVFRSFVPDQQGGGAFTRSLVAAIRAAKKADPEAAITNGELMKAIEATVSEGAFKMTPAICGSAAKLERPFFEV